MSDSVSIKNYLTTLLLTIFLGFFGAHRFYAGKVFTGLLFFFTFGFFFIGWLIDIITVSVGNFTDKTGRFIRPQPKTQTTLTTPLPTAVATTTADLTTPQVLGGHAMTNSPDDTTPSTPANDTTAPLTPPTTSSDASNGGVEQAPKRKVPTWLWVVGGILVLALLVNAFGSGDSNDSATDSPAPAPTASDEPAGASDDVAEEPTEEVSAEPEAGFGDGTYIVGENLEPGIYRSTDTSLCYWERMSGFGGTFDEIIANGNEGTIVEIQATDAGFKTERCGRWLPLEDTYPAIPATQFGDGTYEVGTHIEPGRYSNSGGDNCYYERKSGFTQTFSDIISNDFGSTTAVVEIRESDRGFTTRGCGTWTRAG